jgi:uncharacterized membrane protein YkoI
VQRTRSGQVVAVDLRRRNGGQTYYRVTVVSEAGEYWQVTVDAQSNAVLSMRRR